MEKFLSNKLKKDLSKGDRKSQELLYKQFYSYGMSICLRYTSSRDESLEILHDGFLKVFRHIDQYDTQRPFTVWFRRILINGAINCYRRNAHQAGNIDMAQLLNIPDPGKNGPETLEYMDMIQLIQALPPRYRTVFNLYAIEGYDHQEIAEMLSISAGTSKSNLHRARQKLRAMLTTRNNEKAGIKHE
ncbi:RNA polymerase sigma-70 factor, ECF subfamily [Cyclobacterium lianum]|uniref:RNA polymerase sigma-70 factor, ECF subfamily n=1 Tax=Cyclobacterium lianum TaxID=388280 RepID=A0A1M7QM48_9BACT|nr:RNA polymerase sigma factor [Cyclobacterium lianum]SHN32427.1 RNA polymerase sigma-70 factor, ECF subfamily [Cyclobacterium lianum]